MKRIYEIETIEQLVSYVNSTDKNTIQKQLFSEFDSLFPYKNIQEWNQLVKVCEALAIVGWNEREPLEAYAEKWINGSYYTYLYNNHLEQKDCQEWSKMGETYILHKENSDKTNYGITEISSQRNPLPKNPIRFNWSGNYQKSVQLFVDDLKILGKKLNKEMRPELYGNNFSYIGIKLNFSHHDDPSPSVQSEYFHDENDVPNNLKNKKNPGSMPIYYIRPRLDIGKLSTKKGELRLVVTRHFTKAFGYLELSEQKNTLQEDFCEILDVLAEKLKKKKLKYDTDLLKQDLRKIMAEW